MLVFATIQFGVGCATAPVDSDRRVAQEADSDPDEFDGDGGAADSATGRKIFGSVVLVGMVPNRYLGGSATDSGSALAKVEVVNGIIMRVAAISESDIARIPSSPRSPTLVLRNQTTRKYDVIYPGLIDLHNHTKQNVMPLWGRAKGQFENRFEWRGWSVYGSSVSKNMNPWIGYSGLMSLAAFRWAELQAMVLGTTYLQGPSTPGMVSNFSINRVEDQDSYLRTSLLAIQAPTDLVIPADFTFVWQAVRSRMLANARVRASDIANESSADSRIAFAAIGANTDAALKAGQTFSGALQQLILETCVNLPADAARSIREDVNSAAALRFYGDKAALEKACLKDPGSSNSLGANGSPIHSKFIRYVNFDHKTVAGKIKYIEDPKAAAIIVHLAEGSRLDPYNRLEFEILKLFGLDRAHVNLVHGVGIDEAGFRRMAQKGMGLIWSPFSNLLLYGETARVQAAADAGVPIALGSDWTPTGSKSVLEELKIAKNYLRNVGLSPGRFDDRHLYEMVTENPAQMLNHFGRSARGGHGIGTISVGAMASLIAVSNNNDNAFTNLVDADAKDINLVVIDGKPTYGSEGYLNQFASATNRRLEDVADEALSEDFATDLTHQLSNYPRQTLPSTPREKQIRAQELATRVARMNLRPQDDCRFPERKLLVKQSSGHREVASFKSQTGIDLDRFGDIEKFLAIHFLTQGANRNSSSVTDNSFAPTQFPSLLSCNDEVYQGRVGFDPNTKATHFKAFLSPDRSRDEVSANLRGRAALRRNSVASGGEDHAKRNAAGKNALDYGLNPASPDGTVQSLQR